MLGLYAGARTQPTLVLSGGPLPRLPEACARRTATVLLGLQGFHCVWEE